jgi:hypothetical protein
MHACATISRRHVMAKGKGSKKGKGKKKKKGK